MPYIELEHRKLFYREQGEGPFLLILPGNTASSACHTKDLEYFGQHFHAVSMDFWGTGNSGRFNPWPGDWWKQGAQDAAVLAEYLGVRSCLVIGTSGGAVSALLLAALQPDLVRAVVADSCVECIPPDSLNASVLARQNPSPEMMDFWKSAHGEDWRQVVEADNQLLLDFAESGGDFFNGYLREVVCPVLFTASLQDEVLPDIEMQIFSMSRKIRSSQIFMTREGDHPLMWTRAEDFRCAVDAFFSTIQVSEGQPAH